MTRFTPIDLAAYPVSDVLEVLSFDACLARDRADLQARWNARRVTKPDLPLFDALFLESDPSSAILEVGSYRETILRAHVNDMIRSLTLAGALGSKLDHIGITYYRTLRRAGEDDETYRQRLALAPESWSTAGPVGAYLFWGLSADSDVLDIAAYSEDEGVSLAPHVRVAVLSKTADVTPSAMAELVDKVQAALRRSDIRPLADLVTVEAAVPVPFDVTVHLSLRDGASQALVIEAARKRITEYCSGRLRWIGDGITGPVWLIGRRLRQDTIAAAALGNDSNILEVNVLNPLGDINPPHPLYTASALAGVGSFGFVPLAAERTAHLFQAPKLGVVTVTASAGAGGWS